MKFKKEILIILVIQITEVLGFSLILPFLPFYAQELGANPFVISLILSMFSLLQFVSAPILGRISDRIGRKPVLIASQISTFLGFVILAFSNSLWMIFLSRAVDGLLGSNMTVAQAYISDVSSKKDRSKAFGISGIAFGFGFLIGPAIGGYLSGFGFSYPSLVAAVVSLGTIMLTIFFLPETVKKEKDFKLRRIDLVDFNGFKKYFTDPVSKNALYELFSFLLMMSVWTSNYALFSEKKYGFNAQSVGYVLAYVGLINIVFRGVLIPKLIDKFGEENLKRYGVISLLVGLFIFATTGQIWLMIVGTTFYGFGGGITRPLLMGNVSRSVEDNEQGAIMGVANSLMSLTQIIGPMIGGFLLTRFVPESVMYVSLCIMIAGFLIRNDRSMMGSVKKV